MIDRLMQQLRADEGVMSHAYRDSLGLLTIGVGRLVDPSKPGSGLRPAEIDLLLANDVADRVQQLTARLPWFAALDEVRRAALLNMAFQLGVEGLLAFRDTLGAVRDGRYDHAAVLMLDSRWAKQTPERAKRMSRQIATGEWQS